MALLREVLQRRCEVVDEPFLLLVHLSGHVLIVIVAIVDTYVCSFLETYEPSPRRGLRRSRRSSSVTVRPFSRKVISLSAASRSSSRRSDRRILKENCTSGSLGAAGELRTTDIGFCDGMVAARSVRFAVTLWRFFFIP